MQNSKITSAWASNFVAATDAISAHSASYPNFVFNKAIEDHQTDMDNWVKEYDKLIAEQRRIAAIGAEITGKTVDETLCGALSGMLLATLAKQGVYPDKGPFSKEGIAERDLDSQEKE